MKRLLAILILASAFFVAKAQPQTNSPRAAIATNVVAQVQASNNTPIPSNVISSPSSNGHNSTAFTILVAVLTAVPTSFLGYWFALRQFRSQKWWELKAQAYSRIVEELYNGMEYCSVRSDEFLLGRSITNEREQELNEGYKKTFFELRKVTGMGAYIISDEVAEALEELEKRPHLEPDGPNATPWHEIYEADAEAYKKALTKVRTLAKKDLKVR